MFKWYCLYAAKAEYIFNVLIILHGHIVLTFRTMRAARLGNCGWLNSKTAQKQTSNKSSHDTLQYSDFSNQQLQHQV